MCLDQIVSDTGNLFFRYSQQDSDVECFELAKALHVGRMHVGPDQVKQG